MFNFNSNKNKRIISSIIVLFLILAMIIPTLAYFL